MSTISVVRTEINRPWWYRTFRAISAFSYRYWWLVWLLFILYIVLWYFLCYRTPFFYCVQQEKIKQNITSIYHHLDSCCNCNQVVNHVLPPANAKPCDYDASMNGGKGYTEWVHNLGTNSGMVIIDFNMQNIPDKMEIYYDGQIVATTQALVSGTGSLSFYYPALPDKPTYCKVVLTAPSDGTQWSYHIGCPR